MALSPSMFQDTIQSNENSVDQLFETLKGIRETSQKAEQAKVEHMDRVNQYNLESLNKYVQGQGSAMVIDATTNKLRPLTYEEQMQADGAKAGIQASKVKQLQEIQTLIDNHNRQSAIAAEPQIGSIGGHPIKMGQTAAGGQGMTPVPNAPALPAAGNASQMRLTVSGIGSANGPTFGMRETAVKGATTPEDTAEVQAIGDAIISGEQPPELTRLYGKSAKVRAYLAQKGFNLTKAQTDWTSTQRFATSLNGPQQVRLNQALDSVEHSLPELRKLNEQFKRSNWTPANKAELALAITGTDPVRRDLATKYLGQINLMKDELGQAFMGGGVPTDKAFELADDILKPVYGAKQLDVSIDQLAINLRIRKNAITSATPALVGGNANASPAMGKFGVNKPAATNEPPQYDPKTQRLQRNKKTGEYRVVAK